MLVVVCGIALGVLLGVVGTVVCVTLLCARIKARERHHRHDTVHHKAASPTENSTTICELSIYTLQYSVYMNITDCSYTCLISMVLSFISFLLWTDIAHGDCLPTGISLHESHQFTY